MKILVVYKEDYPWDVRVEKIVEALAEDGHEVTIAANNLSKVESEEILDKHKIYRLPAMRGLPDAVSSLLKLPLWFNPFWFRRLKSLFRHEKFDIVFIRDLPLLKLAVLLKDRYDFRLIYDMAEVYPEMYQSIQDYGKFNLKDFFLKNPGIARRYEKNVIKYVDHTFTMIEESRDRLLSMNVPTEKVSVVSNTPPVQKYHGALVNHRGSTLRIVYVGRLTRLRGIDLLIKGVYDFLRRGNARSNVKVDIVGTGPDKRDLRKLVAKLDLQDCITVHGWLDQHSVDDLMTASNVGVVTYRVCGHWNHTIPNKIFDYMLAGIPVLSTPVSTIGRIVRSVECGIVSPTESPSDIAVALEKLTDPVLRQTLGTNGHKAILSHYNWEKEQVTISRVVNALSPMRFEK